MAFDTLDTRMSSLKIISRKAVIKVVGIKTYHLKVFTMMITVTFNTLFPANLGGSMISPAFRYSDSNIQVTFQALIAGNLFSKDMAFGAV